jgi:hypothetical protein
MESPRLEGVIIIGISASPADEMQVDVAMEMKRRGKDERGVWIRISVYRSGSILEMESTGNYIQGVQSC